MANPTKPISISQQGQMTLDGKPIPVAAELSVTDAYYLALVAFAFLLLILTGLASWLKF